GPPIGPPRCLRQASTSPPAAHPGSPQSGCPPAPLSLAEAGAVHVSRCSPHADDTAHLAVSPPHARRFTKACSPFHHPTLAVLPARERRVVRHPGRRSPRMRAFANRGGRSAAAVVRRLGDHLHV